MNQQTIDQMISLAKKGNSSHVIAKKIGCSQPTVLKYVGRHGAALLPPKRGAKKVLTPRNERYAVQLIEKKICTNPNELAHYFKFKLNISVSQSTMRRTLERQGMVARSRYFKPLLSDENMQKRLAFAMEYKDWTVDDWARCIFSDEAGVELYSRSKTQVWLKKGKRRKNDSRQVHKIDVHHSPKLLVWGCFSSFGRGELRRIQGTVNASLYAKIIKEELPSSIKLMNLQPDKVLFVQDNAPAHKSEKVLDLLDELGIETIEWPPFSPDLNPIENLWGFLKRSVHNYEEPAEDLDELWRRFSTIWNSLTPDFLQAYVESMSKRLQLVIEANGDSIKY